MPRTIDDLSTLNAAGLATGDKLLVRDVSVSSTTNDCKSLTVDELRTFLAAYFQSLDATLTALAGLTISANSIIVGSGSDAFSVVACAANQFLARSSSGGLVAKSITDFGLSLIDDATAGDARTTLGLGTLATQNGTISDYATLASPALTGNPTAPTQSPGNNSTRIATTAFVTAAITAQGIPAMPTEDGRYVLEVDTGVKTWRKAAVSLYAEPTITVTTQGEDAVMEQFSISGGNDETVSASDGSTTADVLFDSSGNVLSVTNTPTNYTAGATGGPSITFTSTIAGDRPDMAKSSGGGGSVSVDAQGTDGVAEVVEISFGGATGGTIAISGSDAIDWDTDAATLESTLEAALSEGVAVTGSAGEFEVTYDNAGAKTDLAVTNNLLTI